MKDADFYLPSPAHLSGYNLVSELLTKIPHQDVPTELIRSNYAPTPFDRSAIRGLVSFGEVSIHNLEAEISKFQVAGMLLELRLSNVQMFKRFQHTLLSPVRMLPDELLTKVFGYVCKDPIDIGSCSGPVWELQLVCVHWKDVVRGTPSLWCKFNVLSEVVINKAAVARRIHRCLKLSGSLPLSIYLIPPKTSTIPLYASKDIANHAGRWVSITIDSSESSTASSLIQLIQLRGLAQLRNLSIKHGGKQSIFDVFKNAVALEELALDKVVSFPIHTFRWDKLKKLTITSCTIIPVSDLFISVFSTMSSLEEFTWSGTYLDVKSAPTILLLSLHTLNVDEYSSSYSLFPLFMLRAPHLTSLQIMDFSNININPFLSSASGIKRLHIGSRESEMPIGFMLNIIKELYGIEELSLTLGRHCSLADPNEIFSKLIWDSHSPSDLQKNLLPSLQKLELINLTSFSKLTGTNTSFGPLMVHFMRSRSPAAVAVAMTKNHASFPVPLSLVKYYWRYQYEDIAYLKSYGKESDIVVEGGKWTGAKR